jgi:hypothetical protein
MTDPDPSATAPDDDTSDPQAVPPAPSDPDDPPADPDAPLNPA